MAYTSVHTHTHTQYTQNEWTREIRVRSRYNSLSIEHISYVHKKFCVWKNWPAKSYEFFVLFLSSYSPRCVSYKIIMKTNTLRYFLKIKLWLKYNLIFLTLWLDFLLLLSYTFLRCRIHVSTSLWWQGSHIQFPCWLMFLVVVVIPCLFLNLPRAWIKYVFMCR